MDLPDILSDEDRTSAGERARSLFFLGRRLERLFLGGVLLVVLSFLSILFTTASNQAKEDNATAGLAMLEESIAKDKAHLTELFQHRNDPPPRTIVAPTAERLKELAGTRKKLGLSNLAPIPPPPPTKPEPQEKYSDVLSNLEKDVIQKRKRPIGN
jgi:hypothetical protein